jgi:hypothetical protein
MGLIIIPPGAARNQARAAVHRSRLEVSSTIKLIDLRGNESIVQQQGRLNRTKHAKILSILEKRALRYKEKSGQLQQKENEINEIDETGTVATDGLTDDDSVGTTTTTQTEAEREELDILSLLSDELLRIHGVMPGFKQEGTVRLMYENPNGFNSKISENEKLRH